MTRYKFFIQLLGINLALLALLTTLTQAYAALQAHQGLYLASLGALSLLCFILFEVGHITARSPNIQLFGQFFLASIGIKMFIALVVFILYIKKYPPEAGQQWFVLPFLLIYLVFTAFEIGFLSKIAKTQPQPDDEEPF